MTPKISFAITTHNEGEYVKKLLEQLVNHCRTTGDEIIVLDDYSDDTTTIDAIRWMLEQTEVKTGRVFRKLQGDFAAHKNYLNSVCTGEYIFQVDADETLHPVLLKYVSDILEANPTTDLFAIPRVNIVNGLTDEDIKRWGWRVNEKGHVMFPDFQTRLYRNSPDIKWEGKVHERIVGYKTMTPLPPEEMWSLYHIKDIERQRRQNEFYATI